MRRWILIPTALVVTLWCYLRLMGLVVEGDGEGDVKPPANNTLWCDLHASPPIKPTCTDDNRNCGTWDVRTRTFDHVPGSCKLRPFAPHEARQCLGNRSVAFVGDSQIRDLGFAVGLFLQERDRFDEYMDSKFDKDELASIYGYGERIGNVGPWKGADVDMGCCGNGIRFPTRTEGLYDRKFQVLVWHLFNDKLFNGARGSSGKNHASDVLHNRLAGENGLRKADFVFMNVGLHDRGLWDKEPFDEAYHSWIMDIYKRDLRDEEADVDRPIVPNAWMSLNSECIGHAKYPRQVIATNAVNQRLGERMMAAGLPYMDADLMLRSPELCPNITADGVHVRMWVDQVRASLLFNWLCNSSNEWIGDESAFL